MIVQNFVTTEVKLITCYLYLTEKSLPFLWFLTKQSSEQLIMQPAHTKFFIYFIIFKNLLYL